MSYRVIKLIFVADNDTAGMIMDHAGLPIKQRERELEIVKFTYTDKHSIDHELHLVHAEEV